MLKSSVASPSSGFQASPYRQSEGWLPCRKLSSSRGRAKRKNQWHWQMCKLYECSNAMSTQKQDKHSETRRRTVTRNVMDYLFFTMTPPASEGCQPARLMQTQICGWAGGVGAHFLLSSTIIYVAWTFGTSCIRARAVLSTGTRSRPPINGRDQGGKLHS